MIGPDVVTAAFDDTDGRKRGIAEQIIQQALNNQSGCVSFQVVQETLNWLNKNQMLHPGDRTAYMETELIPLWTQNPVWQNQPTLDTYLRALQIQDAYQLHFYAGLLVSGAIDAGCQTLYSGMYDSQQKIEGVDIVNPFN